MLEGLLSSAQVKISSSLRYNYKEAGLTAYLYKEGARFSLDYSFYEDLSYESGAKTCFVYPLPGAAGTAIRRTLLLLAAPPLVINGHPVTVEAKTTRVGCQSFQNTVITRLAKQIKKE